MEKVFLTCLLFVGCVGNVAWADADFTMRKGFAEYFSQHPPKDQLPSGEERHLLMRFRPRLYFSSGQQRPINFYSDYIARGELLDDGQMVSASVDQALLNAYADKQSAEFVYSGELPLQGEPTLYGRIDTELLQFEDQSWELTFLGYNLVFPSSGVVEKLPTLASFALAAVGGLRDWHQLDHYVGLTVVLHRQQPIAFYLQQHNYQSSYLVSKVDWPADDRLAVDVARRSNELYLHSEQQRQHPGVSFVNPKNLEFVLTGRNKPAIAGWDVTHGEEEQDYQLAYLRPTDAFYQFKGHLGASRHLPGRNGPPGADYVTIPALMRRSDQLVVGYRAGGLEHEQRKISALMGAGGFSINSHALHAYRQDFIQAWQVRK